MRFLEVPAVVEAAKVQPSPTSSFDRPPTESRSPGIDDLSLQLYPHGRPLSGRWGRNSLSKSGEYPGCPETRRLWRNCRSFGSRRTRPQTPVPPSIETVQMPETTNEKLIIARRSGNLSWSEASRSTGDSTGYCRQVESTQIPQGRGVRRRSTTPSQARLGDKP